MSDEKKEGSLLTQILVPVVITFLVGGTAPWWWNRFFQSINVEVPSFPNISPSPSANSQQTKSTPTAIEQVKNDPDLNLQFTFQECQRSSNIVRCYFFLTKQGNLTETTKQPGYNIYANYIYVNYQSFSRAITPDGEQHLGQLIQAGEKKDDEYLLVEAIQGVPIRIGISFNIPMQFKSLSAFAIQYSNKEDYYEDIKEITFTGVDISP